MSFFSNNILKLTFSIPLLERIIENEDPYYSGLEARITSKKSQIDRNGTKARGLNWMMRKVLSAAAINVLTTRRKSKKSPKSTGSEGSDSDPYVSIAEVYEPIYGTHPHPSQSHHHPHQSHHSAAPPQHWAATGRRRPR